MTHGKTTVKVVKRPEKLASDPSPGRRQLEGFRANGNREARQANRFGFLTSKWTRQPSVVRAPCAVSGPHARPMGVDAIGAQLEEKRLPIFRQEQETGNLQLSVNSVTLRGTKTRAAHSSNRPRRTQ
jgi:hypothetical protein